MAQRVLAVIGAVVLVLVAVVVRSAIDDGGGSGGGPARNDEVVLVCVPELTAACDAVPGATVVLEDSAVTAESIRGGTVDETWDAWMTTSAWVEVVASRAPDQVGEVESLASSPVVVGAVPSRADALNETCAGTNVWRCLGDNAEKPWETIGGDLRWGPLRTGLPDADTGTGLPVLASVVSGYFDGTDFATNDFDTSNLRPWLGQLAGRSLDGPTNPLIRMVTRPGSFSAAASTEVEALSVLNRVALIDTAPPVLAVAVLVDLPGGDPLPDPSHPRDALLQAGWREALGPPTPLLKPGVMAALHTLWTEVTR